MSSVQAGIGFVVFFLIAFALGERKRSVNLRIVAFGIIAQIVLAILFLKVPYIDQALLALSSVVVVLEEVTLEATQFMFGYLAGGPAPYEPTNPNNSFIVAFRVLPLILVVSAFSSVLFHWGVLPKVVQLFAALIQRSLKVSGALSFAASSSVFFGIIESPLLIKPYLEKLDRSELFALLVCGMSTVAGTVMVLYASIIDSVVDGALGHILVASVISVPAALVVAHLMVPPTGKEVDASRFEVETKSKNTMDALMTGTADGTKMIVSIIATIIVLFACVYLTNRMLSVLPFREPWTLQLILGTLFRPLCFFSDSMG